VSPLVLRSYLLLFSSPKYAWQEQKQQLAVSAVEFPVVLTNLEAKLDAFVWPV